MKTVDRTRPEALVLTVQEAGQLLGFEKAAAYAAVARGDIPSVKIGNRIRVPKAAIERLLGGADFNDRASA